MARRGFQGHIPNLTVRTTEIVGPVIRLQQGYPHTPNQVTSDLEIVVVVVAVAVVPEIDVDLDNGDVVVRDEHAAADEHKIETEQTGFSESDQASPEL